MRIDSSTITMAAARNYTAKATEEQTTITRLYHGDQLTNASASKTTAQLSQYEVEGGASVYTTSSAGVTRTDSGQVSHQHGESKPLGRNQADGGQVAALQGLANSSRCGDWIADINEAIDNDPTIQMLRKMLDLLERATGKKFSRNCFELPDRLTRSVSSSYRMSASAVSLRYQETVAMLNTGGGQMGVLGRAGQAVNGHWTRQVVQSGFLAETENTAFTSSGTVVTSDGRTLNFNISLEMSRSFAAAYQITGKEEIYTDPLIINLDTNAAALSDVSFFFDLDSDGAAEELSGLDSSSGFLALDKNGDGTINNGTELFGARTGDGFGELAAYDEDGNGWIDENDDVFSKLSVWVQCGDGQARQLSLAEADVGAIFLGSQNTQYSLTDSYGETGAMIRKTGIYLKESGQVGTVQHVDFKA